MLKSESEIQLITWMKGKGWRVDRWVSKRLRHLEGIYSLSTTLTALGSGRLCCHRQQTGLIGEYYYPIPKPAPLLPHPLQTLQGTAKG